MFGLGADRRKASPQPGSGDIVAASKVGKLTGLHLSLSSRTKMGSMRSLETISVGFLPSIEPKKAYNCRWGDSHRNFAKIHTLF